MCRIKHVRQASSPAILHSPRRSQAEVTGLDFRPDHMLNELGFPFEKQQQRVASLSGGEMRRLHLAAVLARKPNFLILDEPTNDLDLATIEVRCGAVKVLVLRAHWCEATAFFC